ncbi:MAG: hypothetical protein ACRD06_00445 [Terriglobia bacterium]
MKRITIGLASLAALLCVGGVQAATMNQANVVRDYTDTVAPADQQAYEAGIKAYNQCLSQHGFKFTWGAWTHVTGNTYMYSYDSDPSTWADFDAMHSAGSVCDSVWESQVNPHLMSETSALMVMMPEMSNMPKGADLGTGLIDVTFFNLKQGHEAQDAFMGAAKMVAAAAAKTNWPGIYAFTQIQDAGPGAPDFVLVWPAKNWADYGQDINPPLWKMVENAYGKNKADEIRKTINDAIVGSSSHLDAYSSDLTYKSSDN